MSRDGKTWLVCGIAPYFWQALRFRIAAGAVKAAAVVSLFVARERRMLRLRSEALERQRADERERAPVAHDRHGHASPQSAGPP